DDTSLWSNAKGKLDKMTAMLGAHFGETNPRRVQLRFLQGVRRVVKEPGRLFVGCEDRLCRRCFTGRSEHHSGLMFGSLLPRGVATVYSIARARVPYRTYTYAYPGYRRLMREAGFGECRFLGLTPGYSHLSEIVPFTGEWRGWSRRR